MKKIAFMVLLPAVALHLFSCSKQHKCHCQYIPTPASQDYGKVVKENTKIKGDNLEDAKKQCQQLSWKYHTTKNYDGACWIE